LGNVLDVNSMSLTGGVGCFRMIENKESASARELIYNKLKSDITLGNIKPGERLLESELATEFKVSRTPILEVIRQLRSEGLVKVESLGGATVTKLSMGEIREIYSIRIAFESFGTELAVKNFSKKEREILKQFKQTFKKHLTNRKYLEWLEANIRFRLFFAENVGDSCLYRLLKDLRGRVHRYQFIAATSPCTIQQYTKEHEQITDAAVKGNSKLARRNMERHLFTAHRVLTDFLNKFLMI
jgi:DNA-binding GntR family transcriptional regulator